MLQLEVPEMEFFDSSSGTFIMRPAQTLELEHSLISLSRWESKWKKPFLSEKNHDLPEIQDYIRCMTINQRGIDPEFYKTLDVGIIKQVEDYISDSHTATVITERASGRVNRNQTITSELIYSWMIANEIPFQCEKWHLNRLLTLIRICSIHNTPPKMMSKRDIYAQNRALNAKRRAALHSRG